ncbi:MAG: SRPBCC family protein [Bacillota bacterium]
MSFPSRAAPAADPGDLSVNVRKSAGAVVVDARMAVEATQRQVWDVLTDYDRMAQFFPNLVSSRIAQRSGDTMRVEQKGNVSYGPFAFDFESVRDIALRPYGEIRSHAVSGSLKSGTAITRLIADGAITWVLYHSESVPAMWVPPAIGPRVIADQTRAQFESLRAEILRRKDVARTAGR